MHHTDHVPEVPPHLGLGESLAVDHVVEIAEAAVLLDHDDVVALVAHPGSGGGDEDRERRRGNKQVDEARHVGVEQLLADLNFRQMVSVAILPEMLLALDKYRLSPAPSIHKASKAIKMANPLRTPRKVCEPPFPIRSRSFNTGTLASLGGRDI
jgi:hypothetical protein